MGYAAFDLSQTDRQTDRQRDRQRDRQTNRHFIRRILAYIVIQNGLQYNAHDSDYSSI